MSAEFDMSRVSLEVPTQDLPELVAYLGGYTVDHSMLSIDIEPVAPADTTEAAPREDFDQYNPDMITIVAPSSTEPETAAITKSNFRAFSQREGLSGKGLKLLHAFEIKFNGHPFHYDTPKSMLRPYAVVTPVDEFVGLRADRAERLLATMQAGTLEVYDVGDATIEFFDAYCAKLRLTPPTE